MTTLLNLADLAFLQAAVVAGPFHAPGTDPLTLEGTRSTDGTFNNLSDQIGVLDQYGNTVNTADFGTTNQPFFHVAGSVTSFATGFEADGVTPYVPGSSPGNPWYQGVEYAPGDNVVDNAPRLISTLVSSSQTGGGDTYLNAAAVAAEASANPITGNPGNAAIGVQPTNALFTFFGQFFDHGLDFINKGGSGTVSGDFLGPTSRATLDGNGNVINSTAPLVEQSQTYGSGPSTTFYLMEYDASGNPTGRLVTHSDGTMATWADIKANALNKGITLLDSDAFNMPEPIFNGLPNNYTKGAGTGQNLLADNALFPGGAPQDAHLVAGDGRVNENAALTSIHEAFHNEHNRLVLEIEDLIAQQDQITPGSAAQWTGDRIFEAAKLVNEMQYQHFVFEEFARRMSPNVDEFAQYDITINPNISLEFSQAIYRLGHSQLTDTVMTTNAMGQTDEMTLVEAFLNPELFTAIGAGDFIKGQTNQQMNQIDEFVVDSVRNLLLGQSLDLAAINIARGRDVNLPTLNQLRTEMFEQTGGAATQLTPYTSWSDFAGSMEHPESLVNFIAAYARGGTVAGDAVVAARDAVINSGDPTSAELAALRAAATTAAGNVAFMSGDQGFWDIDLWIGGLAEAHVQPILGGTSAGMLGSTFDAIFAAQMVALQNGDRLYYLDRLGGTNILDQLEGGKFAEVMERGTGARHLNGDVFGAADEAVELSSTNSHSFTSAHAATDFWSEVVGGTTLADTISTLGGNDTVWAEAGDDIISTGNGNDVIFGGTGNDNVNAGADNDFIRGDAGNDIIDGGAGDDTVFAAEGNDTVIGGVGADLVFGGKGDDTISGGDQDDRLVGDENDDVITGGAGNDTLEGGADQDYLDGGIGADTLLGLDGDDVMLGGAGADVIDGGLTGYDLAIYNTPGGVGTLGLTIDMAGLASTGEALGDVLLNIDEVRGTAKNDIIFGDAFDNVLSGGGGFDQLNGLGGNDTLYSNTGSADLLNGGIGIDMGVWLGFNFADATIAMNPLGDGSVTVNGFTDTLTGVELLAFDDGIWSVTTSQFVPLIGVANSSTLVINGIELDGNLVSNQFLLDNTVIPAAGIFVGNIDIIDPDGASGARAVTIAGADAASFRVATGPGGVQQLFFMGGVAAAPGAKINFEAKEHYDIALAVADVSGGSAINWRIKVQDIDDNAPLFTSPDRANAFVGADTDVVVYRATASDRDLDQTMNFTMAPNGGGNNNNLFQMTDNGEVRFAGPPVAGTYMLEVRATDSGGHVTTKMAEIVVSPTPNPAPTVTFNAPVLANDSGASNADFITLNGSVNLSGTYADPGGAVTQVQVFSGNTLLGNATLNAGNWTFATNLAEGTHALRVVASDNGIPTGTAQATGQTIVVDQTSAATIVINPVTADNTVSLAEAPGVIAITGTVGGDAHAGDTVALTVNGNVINGVVGVGGTFSINVAGTQLVNDVDQTIQASVSGIDLAGNAYAANDSQTYAVQGTSNAAPVIISNGGGAVAAVNVLENTTAVTTVAATDADLNPIAYAIVGGADQLKFAIGSNGALSFLAAPDFETPTDVGANNVYEVQVQASDGLGGTDVQAISVTVTNAVETPGNIAPVITSNGGGLNAAVNVLENATAVTTVAASDADLDTLAFSIVGGADQARFVIDPTTGALAFASAPNFEAPTDVGGNNVYDVQVQVADGNGGTDVQGIAVTVTDVVEVVPEPPHGNMVVGTAGKDRLDGSYSPPTTAYDDTVLGKGAADKLFGLGGNDTLKGGKGKDLLNGGTGDDHLYGNKGKDKFVFATGYDNDTIHKYQEGKDSIDLTGSVFGSFAEMKSSMTQVGNGVVIDFGGGDTLTILDATLASLKANKSDFDFV